MSGEKKIRWVKRWAPTCPYDKTELRVRGGSNGFVFYCPHSCCERDWPMTKRDEVKVKEEIRSRDA